MQSNNLATVFSRAQYGIDAPLRDRQRTGRRGCARGDHVGDQEHLVDREEVVLIRVLVVKTNHEGGVVGRLRRDVDP